MGVGITGYAAYLPLWRINSGEYKKAWGHCAADFVQKPVPAYDEDAITMGVEAARQVLKAGAENGTIRVLAVASSNFPYQSRILGGTFCEMLGLPDDTLTLEFSNSDRSGTEALLALLNVVEKNGEVGLVVAADVPRAAAKDDLEHGTGAGAVAVLCQGQDAIVELEGYASAVAESLGESFRPAGSLELEDVGVRAYTSSAYAATTTRSVSRLLRQLGTSPSDYKHLVIQGNDRRQARSVAKKLGFSEAQYAATDLYAKLGNVGAAGALLGMTAAFDLVTVRDRVLVVSYGSGCGSHALSFRVTGDIGLAKKGHPLTYWMARGREIDYISYLKLRRQII